MPDLGNQPGLWFGDHTLLLYPGRNVASRHEKIFLTSQILFYSLAFFFLRCILLSVMHLELKSMRQAACLLARKGS